MFLLLLILTLRKTLSTSGGLVIKILKIRLTFFVQKSGLQPGVSPVSRSPRTGLASRGQGQGVQVKDRPNEKKQGGSIFKYRDGR